MIPELTSNGKLYIEKMELVFLKELRIAFNYLSHFHL